MRRVARAGLVCFALGLGGCSFSSEWGQYWRARRAVARGDNRAAVAAFRELVERDPDGGSAATYARQGARVAHLELKDYPVAVEFYKTLVRRSTDPVERSSAQRYIAQIYFDNLLDYDQAVIEFERLLKLEHRPEEAFRYRLNLAKSHFQLNNLEQAENELDVILGQKHSPDEIFEAKLMKGNILVSRKRPADAAVAWAELLKDFPERSKKESVALNLVVCFEELKEFDHAIETLERMKGDYANPEFLNARIERLARRRSNLPGAQGLKR